MMSSEATPRFTADWADLKRIGWLFSLLLANSFILSLLARAQASPWADVVGEIGSAVIVLAFVLTRPSDVLPLVALRRFSVKPAAAFAGIAITFFSLMGAYMTLVERLGVPFIQISAPFVKAGWSFWSVLLLCSAAPAIFEEIAFRGIIQSTFERVLGAREAWLIQGALFCILHLLPMMFPSHFVMGLCFGHLRRRFGSLYPGMLLHATWNAFALLQEWIHV